MPSPETYCTLLYNDSYLPGALVLGHALRDAGTQKQLAVIVGPDVSGEARKRLAQVYDHLLPTETIANTQADAPQFKLLGRPDLERSYTKINVWLQTQFSKIVFLDADTLPLKNVDALFDLFPLSHATGFPIAAAPDIGWPDIFNSGVFVTLPNKATFDALSGRARGGLSFDGGDQGLLNQFFGDKWHHLPFTYNVTPSASYQYTPAYNHFKDQVSIVHFIGSQKPWTNSLSGPAPSSSSFEVGWWEVYNKHYDASLNLKQVAPQETPVLDGESVVQRVFDQISADNVPPQAPAYIPTIEPDVNRWDPTRFLPPRNSKPEAGSLVVGHYENVWDNPPREDPIYNRYVEHQHMHYDPNPAPPPPPPHPPIHHQGHACHHPQDYSHTEEEVVQENRTPEPEPEPPVKAIFPWETQERQVERIFPEDYEDYEEEEEEDVESDNSTIVPADEAARGGAGGSGSDNSPAAEVTRQFRDYSIEPQHDTLDTRRANVWDSDPRIQSWVKKFATGSSRKTRAQHQQRSAAPVSAPRSADVEQDEEEEQVDEAIKEADDELKHQALVHTKIQEQTADGVILKRNASRYKPASRKSGRHAAADEDGELAITSGLPASALKKIDTVSRKRQSEGAPLYLPVTPNPIKLREQGFTGGLSDASSDEDAAAGAANISDLEDELDAGEEEIEKLPAYTDEEEVPVAAPRAPQGKKPLERKRFEDEHAEEWDPYSKLEELAQLATLLSAKQAEFERVYGRKFNTPAPTAGRSAASGGRASGIAAARPSPASSAGSDSTAN